MERPKGSKASFFDHYKQIEKTTGKTHEKLQISDNPPRLLYLWQAYLEVMGRHPLTWQELEAWQRMTAKRVTPFEAKIIFQLDRLNKWTT